MVSYKLDKYDKYFVAFILVIVTIVSLCNCVNAVEDTIPTTFLSCSANSDAVLINNDSALGYYFPIEAGHTYTIDFNMTNDNEYLRVMYSSETPTEGVQVFEFITLPQRSDTYTFNAIDNGYMYCYIYTYNYSSNNFEVESVRDVTSTMASTVGSLVDNVGPQQLWSVFESGIDFVGVVVLVAFGLFLIVLLIKKLSKGKSDF